VDTLGSLVDKLCTVDLKMWNAQEDLYKIRRMTFEEFYAEYGSYSKMKELYDVFKKSCDLNYQRNQLIDEIDLHFGRVVTNRVRHSMGLDSELVETVQLKHKTY
jgi:hypothetical protein